MSNKLWCHRHPYWRPGLHTKEPGNMRNCVLQFLLFCSVSILRALITPNDPVHPGSPPTPVGSGALFELSCVRRVHLSSLVLLLFGYGRLWARFQLIDAVSTDPNLGLLSVISDLLLHSDVALQPGWALLKPLGLSLLQHCETGLWVLSIPVFLAHLSLGSSPALVNSQQM